MDAWKVQLVSSLLPLALLVVLGALLQRFRFVDTTFRRGLDRLVYWVALPALILTSLVQAPNLGGPLIGRMTLVLGLATLGIAALALGLAAVLRLPRPQVGVLVQASLRGNLAFVGLPVVTLASRGNTDTVALAAVLLTPVVLLYNVLCVAALVGAQTVGHPGTALRASLTSLGRSLVTNPLLLACVLGLGVWWLRGQLSDEALAFWSPWLRPVGVSLQLLGMPAAPLALLSLGGSIVVYPLRGSVLPAAVGSLLKCAGVPLVAWGLCDLLGVDGSGRQVVLIFAACPTAVASYVLAVSLRGDGALAAAGIVLSTLLSLLSLGAVLALTAS